MNEPNLFRRQEWEELLETLPQMSGLDIYHEGKRHGLFADMREAWNSAGHILEEKRRRPLLTFADYLQSRHDDLRQTLQQYLHAQLSGEISTRSLEEEEASRKKAAMRKTIAEIQENLRRKNISHLRQQQPSTSIVAPD